MYCHTHHCHYHHCNCVPKDSKETGRALTQEELLAYTQEMKEELKDYTVDLKDQIFSYIDIGVNPVEIANTFASLKEQDTYILRTLTNKIDELNNTTNLSMYNLRTRVTGLEAQSATIIQDLNSLPFEDGVLADTFVTVTTNAVGSVARTQRDVNSDSVHINTFGGDISVAGDWVKLSTSNFCELAAGVTYRVTRSDVTFLNRFYCENGTARLVIEPQAQLTFIEKLDGSEVVYLKNLEYIILGHRGGVGAAPANSAVYNSSDALTEVKSSYIAGVDARAVLDEFDLESWSDDVGKTRCPFFIRITVTNTATIKDCNHYGFGIFYGVKAASPLAKHYEENIHGYNFQTSVWVIPSDFYEGESYNLSGTNTKAQQEYWLASSAGRLSNGMDVLLIEGKHSHRCVVDNIRATNAIERSVYALTYNLVASNILDDGCESACNIKSVGAGDATLKNSKSINNPVGVSYYNIDNFSVDDLSISSDVQDLRAAIGFYGIDTFTLNNVYVKNKGVAFYLTGTDDGRQDVGKLTISNVVLEDVYQSAYGSNVFVRRGGLTAKIMELVINNLKHSISNTVPTASVGSTAYNFTGVTKATLKNCEGVSNILPYSLGDCERLELNDCNFTLFTDAAVENVITSRLRLATLKASVFNMTVTLERITDNVWARVTMQKAKDTGLVQVFEHWKKIEYEADIFQTDKSIKKLGRIGDKSLEVTARLGLSQLKFLFDAEARTVSLISNLGGKFTTDALETTKILLRVEQNRTLELTVGADYVGGDGTVMIECKSL